LFMESGRVGGQLADCVAIAWGVDLYSFFGSVLSVRIGLGVLMADGLGVLCWICVVLLWGGLPYLVWLGR
jgi:hypothetical protein